MPEIANDFAARADWGVSSRFEDANHAPTVHAEGRTQIAAPAGGTVTLSVRADDPDGDPLAASWWIYVDASTLTGTAAVIGKKQQGMEIFGTLTVPKSARQGERIVVVASISDRGTPSLTRYAQFVVTVSGGDEAGGRSERSHPP